MNYYEEKINADNHPLSVAYRKFESDLVEAQGIMSANRFSYDLYVKQEQRATRLIKERQALLAIMASDLTADLLVAKLANLEKKQ